MADNQTICPFCNDSILIPEEYFGSEVECPSCHKQFHIPKVVVEDRPSGGIDSPVMGEFDCPLCGKTNQIPENFAGKVKCKYCHQEIDVINEDLIPCPHCGEVISKEDTTCIFCQRSVDEPPQKTNETSPQETNDVPEESVSASAVITAKIKPLKKFENGVLQEKELETAAENDTAAEKDWNERDTVRRTLVVLGVISFLIFLLTLFAGVYLLITDYHRFDFHSIFVMVGVLYVTLFNALALYLFHCIHTNVMRVRIATERKSGSNK